MALCAPEDRVQHEQVLVDRARCQATLGDDLVAAWAHGGTTSIGDPAHRGDLDTYVILARRPDAPTAQQIEAEHAALAAEHGVADRLLLLAVEDGDVVGCGIADRSDTAGAGFVAPRVLPERRRLGVGSALLSRAETEALDRGRWLLMLDAVAGGGPEALYRGSGWQVLGVVPDFAVSTDGDLQPCVFMWKRLVP